MKHNETGRRRPGRPKGIKKVPGSGRMPGTPNRSTQAAREAIAMFVDNNAHRLQEWLDDVAKGVQDNNGKWLVEPNPQKAYEMFQSVIEYHVPKLQRTEQTGANGGPIQSECSIKIVFDEPNKSD